MIVDVDGFVSLIGKAEVQAGSGKRFEVERSSGGLRTRNNC